MKQIILVISVFSGVLMLVAGQCPFDPLVACNHGDFEQRNVYYARDGCNCGVFWQCKRVGGQIVAHKRECPPCSCFSDDTWVCSDFQNPLPGQVCPTQSPINETITIIGGSRLLRCKIKPGTLLAEYLLAEIEHCRSCCAQRELRSCICKDSCYRTGNGPAGNYTQQYKDINGDLTSFIWVVSENDVIMKCPPGTAFDFSNMCQCVACTPGQQCATQNNRVFRMNFDNVTELQGVYVDASASLTVVPGGIVGLGGKFDGTGDIAIPFFQNNDFCDFTFSFWFNRNASGTAGDQGLISNGNNRASDCAATIRILSTDTTVSATIITTNATTTITHTQMATHGSFHHVVLRYNCTRLDLFVDGAVQSTAAYGTTLRTKCSMLIGHSVDSTDIPRYFKGIFDEVRFYRQALSDVDVSRLRSSPGSNP